MKKIMLSLACLALGCPSSSAVLNESSHLLITESCLVQPSLAEQSKEKHLKFAGIPIDGSLQKFGEQMQKKRYKLLYEDKELLIFRGSHAGKKDCLIYVYAHPDNGVVYMVGVNFGAESRWDKLKYRYLRLKLKMTEMFGEPVLCTEVFHTPESPRTQAEKMDFIREDKVEYVSGFRTSTGLVSVQIVHSPKVDKEKASVMLYYTDRMNCVDSVPGQP